VEADAGQMAETAGQMLRRIRRARNVTQRALGNRLGLTDSAVSAWEKDDAIPMRNHAMAVDELLGAEGMLLQAFGYVATTVPVATLTTLSAEVAQLREQVTDLARQLNEALERAVLAQGAAEERPPARARRAAGGSAR